MPDKSLWLALALLCSSPRPAEDARAGSVDTTISISCLLIVRTCILVESRGVVRAQTLSRMARGQGASPSAYTTLVDGGV